VAAARRAFLGLCLLSFAGHAAAQKFASEPAEDKLKNYLVDISAGGVAAGGLVGLTGSAIPQIETSQDLVIALKPFSSGGSKNGFGLAITPARTAITPMSGASYRGNAFYRFLGGVTLSYAESTANLSSVSYTKSAFSIDSTFYLDPKNDPVLRGYEAFKGCDARRKAEAAAQNANDAGDIDERKKQQQLAVEADKKCKDEDNNKNKAAWNAGRIAISYGQGWIRPESTSGSKESLGKAATLSAIAPLGSTSAINVALRRTVHEVDLTTLQASPSYKSSTLVAARFTQAAPDNGDLRAIAEVSNAKSSAVTASNSAFKYAVGVDKKIYEGIWLQFRIGRNRTADGTSSQTTSLLALSWAPTATLGSN
jgi:hypothetical protein